MLKIYDSLTKAKTDFVPLIRKKITLYVCGMTVYDFCHLGHARVQVAFDVITRFLRSQGYEVTYVRNITDIDDKIIKRANENGEPFEKLTQRMIDAMNEDFAKLGVAPPDHEPRATEFIPQMIVMIETLIEKDFAYAADNGDVYYDVAKFSNYGCLAHKDLEGQNAGHRVDVEDAKRSPLDFVLWKSAKSEEPHWNSPWGAGRPGWHIECSAMSSELLGDTFDIHGGGFDLQFPHHENEIAQSCAASGEDFAKTWMHVGFLQINKEKMSKSLGNFFTIRDVLKKYPAEVVRYFLLSSNYRSQLNYSQENLDSARGALERFYSCLQDLNLGGEVVDSEYSQKFVAAMNDDFNTPAALAVLFDMTHEINSAKNSDVAKANSIAAELRSLGGVLGIIQQSPSAFLKGDTSDDEAEMIEAQIVARTKARADKNWAESDRIRDELLSQGIELLDGADGTTWRRR